MSYCTPLRPSPGAARPPLCGPSRRPPCRGVRPRTDGPSFGGLLSGTARGGEAPVKIKHVVPRQALRLNRRPPVSLSKKARQRLKWLDWHRAHGRNASLTCPDMHRGISRTTFYLWQKRFSALRPALRCAESDLGPTGHLSGSPQGGQPPGPYQPGGPLLPT